MKFEDACKKAMGYFRKEYGDIGLYPAMDVGDRWVFSGYKIKDEILYGKQSIAIDKFSGEQAFFFCLMKKILNC